MPTIYIDNQPYDVPAGQNLLHACLSLGFNIPYFCWHPALHSVGSCRLCAVKQFKDENDTQGKIVMSCMTQAKDGVRISIDDPEVLHFRKSVIEWLMLNHPHDCPVCDEGGECHLQDMTVLAGHTYRRDRFKKRTYRNQDLGPFIRHEMNRCIQCYRCVRFYIDYAGGRDLDVFGWHDRVYFGKNRDGVLKSEFSGNLVEICPTGVFTDKTFYRHFTRKWDLESAPSVCTHCGLGCNIHADSRYGRLRRIRTRYHKEVNSYFLCDRGRFGYEFVNSDKRLHRCSVRDVEGMLTAQSHLTTLDRIAKAVQGKTVIGVGSPRASLESNFALQKLVGEENFYAGVPSRQGQMVSNILDILRQRPLQTATMEEVSLSDAVVVLGEDVLNTAPMLGLARLRAILQKPSAKIQSMHIEPWEDAAVREALQQERGPLYIAATEPTGLDDSATEVYRAAPENLARLGFAIANQLDRKAPTTDDVPDEMNALARRIAADLNDAKHPCVIAGVSLADPALIEAAANIAQVLFAENPSARIAFVVPACNSMGLGLLGGRPLEDAAQRADEGGVDTLIVLENDLTRQMDANRALQLFRNVPTLVVLDSIRTRTVEEAAMALPAATFAESDGTFVNFEGRAQRFFRAMLPPPEIRESWRWIREILCACGKLDEGQWQRLDDIIREMAESRPALRLVPEAAKPADFRMLGQKIPRQTHRYSGRTAMHADRDVREHRRPEDEDSALAFSMEGYSGQPPASLVPHYWAPHWNSVQSMNKYQDGVGGPLKTGISGKRLIEPTDGAGIEYFSPAPEPAKPREGFVLIVPSYRIFGSEELSSLSPSIRQLIPRPFAAVNPADMPRLETRDDGTIEAVLSGTSYSLAVRANPSVPKGLVVVTAGLDAMRWDGIPLWQNLARGPK